MLLGMNWELFLNYSRQAIFWQKEHKHETNKTKNKWKNPPQNSKPLRVPCSSPNRQPIPVQNWTGEATAWKGKCIHLKHGCTGKKSDEGGSHPQPSLCEAEKHQSPPLRHTKMTFLCVFQPKCGSQVLYLGKERARSCLTKVRVPACTGLEPSSGSV